jgi:nickel-dependent lactate racemase
LQTELAFGKSGLQVDLPEGPSYSILRARHTESLANVDAALATALDRPTGTAPLRKLASGKATAAISVCDITQPAPNTLTLPQLLSRLEEVGIPKKGITILIATGLHRPASDDEIQVITGQK